MKTFVLLLLLLSSSALAGLSGENWTVVRAERFAANFGSESPLPGLVPGTHVSSQPGSPRQRRGWPDQVDQVRPRGSSLVAQDRSLATASDSADSPAALAEGPQPFVRGSWQGLRQEHTGRPMIVHFWGVTCGPCLVELPRWGGFIGEKPGVDIVMVAADPVVGERKAIAGVLAKAGCAAAESWMFADPFTDRLAYEVDPSWAGELPYTLLVAANGSVTAILGEVEFSELRAWVAEQARGATGGPS